MPYGRRLTVTIVEFNFVPETSHSTLIQGSTLRRRWLVPESWGA